MSSIFVEYQKEFLKVIDYFPYILFLLAFVFAVFLAFIFGG